MKASENASQKTGSKAAPPKDGENSPESSERELTAEEFIEALIALGFKDGTKEMEQQQGGMIQPGLREWPDGRSG